ncbi:hypothetical protein [Acidicapsa acidisoli]|uniref:hypothetical protein n=1 Tax=Acidicapsa acidisoli TaxID=1615681 RepID=UPI0021E01C05|nr:hypothetical protein [Acidicapsa acidisoli]
MKMMQGWRGAPIQLNLKPPPRKETRPASPPQPATPVPGNFFYFEVFIELKLGGAVYIGYPKVAIRSSNNEVRWGSKMEFSWPDPSKPHAPWIDDPERGIAHRTLDSVEDVLGAEGTIGGRRYRFETILELGNNVIVYGLYNPETRTRTAYGFSRGVFDGTYSKRGMFTTSCVVCLRLKKTLLDREHICANFHSQRTIRESQKSPDSIQLFLAAQEESRTLVDQSRTELALHESTCENCKVASQS